MMSGLIAPQSPSETRWDTLWRYMQGGPGVFKGDLHFYRVDGDFRDRVSAIDTSTLSALPAHRRVRLLVHARGHASAPPAKIPGARVTVMKEIGHFPMSENPVQFRRYLLPVLDEIRARG